MISLSVLMFVNIFSHPSDTLRTWCLDKWCTVTLNYIFRSKVIFILELFEKPYLDRIVRTLDDSLLLLHTHYVVG